MISGGRAGSASGGEVEGGLGFAAGGQVVGGRGKEGGFVGVMVVVGAVVLGRKVAFEHKSECVKIGLGWYGALLIAG